MSDAKRKDMVNSTDHNLSNPLGNASSTTSTTTRTARRGFEGIAPSPSPYTPNAANALREEHGLRPYVRKEENDDLMDAYRNGQQAWEGRRRASALPVNARREGNVTGINTAALQFGGQQAQEDRRYAFNSYIVNPIRPASLRPGNESSGARESGRSQSANAFIKGESNLADPPIRQESQIPPRFENRIAKRNGSGNINKGRAKEQEGMTSLAGDLPVKRQPQRSTRVSDMDAALATSSDNSKKRKTEDEGDTLHAAKKIREEECENCKSFPFQNLDYKGHKLKDCTRGVGEDGYIDTCPWCNTRKHNPSTCLLLKCAKDAFHFLVQRRAGKPPFKCHWDLSQLLPDLWRNQAQLRPQTPEYAKRRLLERGRQELGTRDDDPTWAMDLTATWEEKFPIDIPLDPRVGPPTKYRLSPAALQEPRVWSFAANDYVLQNTGTPTQESRPAPTQPPIIRPARDSRTIKGATRPHDRNRQQQPQQRQRQLGSEAPLNPFGPWGNKPRVAECRDAAAVAANNQGRAVPGYRSHAEPERNVLSIPHQPSPAPSERDSEAEFYEIARRLEQDFPGVPVWSHQRTEHRQREDRYGVPPRLAEPTDRAEHRSSSGVPQNDAEPVRRHDGRFMTGVPRAFSPPPPGHGGRPPIPPRANRGGGGRQKSRLLIKKRGRNDCGGWRGRGPHGGQNGRGGSGGMGGRGRGGWGERV